MSRLLKVILICIVLVLFCNVVSASSSSVSTISWVDYFIHNPIKAATKPYTDLIGVDIFIAWVFIAIGGALYLSERNLAQLVGYFMIVFLFAAVALNAVILLMFGIIAALITTSLLYNSLVVKNRIR